MTVDEIVAEIRIRFKNAQDKVEENKTTADAGFYLGYHDALGELLEFITED